MTRRNTVSFLCLWGLFLSLPWGGIEPLSAQEKSWVSITIQEKKLRAEVVRTEEEKARGLMYRERLGNDEGMLFVYEEEEFLSFWMKNTRIPLSIAFIDRTGKIVDIQDMEPFQLKHHVSAQPAVYALEVNQGWFRKNGLRVGHQVKFPPELRK